VLISLPDYLIPPSGVTSMTVSRAVSGVTGLGAFTTLYTGVPQPIYLDVGDYLPGPLDPNVAYVWQVTDNRGTSQAGPVSPGSSMISIPDELSQILIRLLQGSLNSVPLPGGMTKRIQVMTKMPQGGWSALPFIVVNLDLIQQTETQIGEDVLDPIPGNEWTIWSNAKRVWRISIFSADAEERDFYRDTLLNVLRVLKATAFAPIGLNVVHSFQATSGTSADEWNGHIPGFYYADLLFELDGVFNTTVLTGFGYILGFTVDVTVNPDSSTITAGP